MKIKHSETDSKGLFEAFENDAIAGNMSYSKAGEKLIIIDHTEVNPEFKGKLVGYQLLIAAIEYARLNQLKIIPLCPFAKSVFDKKTELRDVLK
jgi:uncharacterized protein